tara:strand:+ start:1945 stop:2187 length:243 start_codon:yes stop_codon:yes gene_type:complete
MPSGEWIKQSKREQVGKLIKENLNYTSDEHLGHWFEEHKIAIENIIKDGKFSKEGMSSLDRLASLEKMLLTEHITGEKIL